MIQKAITKYGLAFHLAVLAALPSALAPFVPDVALGRMVLWLSVIGALWVFVEPSIRQNEHLSQARSRVWGAFLYDPVFWFFVLLAVMACIRWLNSGVELAYDPEKVVWKVAEPAWSIFPASSGDAGFLPFAVSVACLVLVAGLRHAVGLAARISFALTGAFIAGVGGWAAAIAACAGRMPFVADAASGFGVLREPLMGAVWGVWFLVTVSAGAQAELRGWRRGRIVHCLAAGGNAVGLVFFSQSYVSAAYLAAGLLFAIYSWVWMGRSGSKGAIARDFIFGVLGVALASFLLMAFAPEKVKTSKFTGFDPSVVWRDEIRDADKALSGMARRMWLQEPWCGVGLGGFRLKAPFVAHNEDWEVVPPNPVRAVNGYWTLLAERGNVMCGLFAVGLGLMFWAWGSRCVEAFLHLRKDADSDMFPFSCPPIVWTPILFIPLIAVEGVFASVFSVGTLLLAAMAVLALATASFPRRPSGDKQKENS
jgi:hypothetical protein